MGGFFLGISSLRRSVLRSNAFGINLFLQMWKNRLWRVGFSEYLRVW